MSQFFIPPEILSFSQLVFLTVVYGYLLFTASNFISDGSELLLLVPSVAGIVGSVVLPVLGAVPDGAMIIFSALGENAEEEVFVGVGTLAGSTIMLLTIPWFLCVLGGKVPVRGGQPDYRGKTDPSGDEGQGVTVSSLIRRNGLFMVISGLTLYSAPNFSNGTLIGAIACLSVFVLYLYRQYRDSQIDPSVVESMISEKRFEMIRSGQVSFRGALEDFVRRGSTTTVNPRTSGAPLLENSPSPVVRGITDVLAHFFPIFDINKDGVISEEEFRLLMHELGESLSAEESRAIFAAADLDNSGSLEPAEFVALMTEYAKRGGKIAPERNSVAPAIFRRGSTGVIEDDEEVPEVPEDLASLSPAQQQRRIKGRAAWMLGLGTLMVLVFSDPAVGVVCELGKRTGIPTFYLSFVLAPLFSNASELIAAYHYAQQRTRKSITVALSSLEGAAIMNNTYCLGIFYALVYFRGIKWNFFPQVVAILFVQIVVGFLAITKRMHQMSDALVILSLYPASLIIVALLTGEN